MRVDFLGSFKQVQKLINSKATQVQPEQEFKQVFESSGPQPAMQPAENNQEIQQAVLPLKISEERGRARYDFSKPEFLNPLPQAREVPKPQFEPVNQPSAGVKTPSGISGRLVKIEDPFAGLSKVEKKEIVGRLVSLAGEEHGIDPSLSLGVIKAESNFNPVAVSSDGHASKGLMQLLDSTGKDMMARLGIDEHYTPFDPEQNIDLGVGYLKRLHDVFSVPTDLGGNLRTIAAANSSSLEKLAVAAYNAGEGRVASAQQRAKRFGKDPALYENIENYLPEITREYVRRVMANRSQITESNKG